MPEGRINPAQPVIALALAPKSNAVIMAIDVPRADVQTGRIGTVPAHLRDTHYPGAARIGHGESDVYAHDQPHAVAAQRYLPDELAGAGYSEPTWYGAEAALADRLAGIEELLGRASRDA